MKEQFDKKLAEKIKVSFQHHEEHPDPKKWEKLSQAYFKPKQGMIFPVWSLWLSGIAASLLLLFFFYPNIQNINVENISVVDSLPGNGSNEEKKENIVIPSFKENDGILAENEDKSFSSGKDQGTGNNKLKAENFQEKSYPAKSNNEQISSLNSAEAIILEENSMANEISDIPETLTSQQTLISLHDDAELEKAKESIKEWLDVVKPEMQEKEAASSTELFRLGILVSPQSISNATQSLNLGAGIMSEFSFSKRLKLDVGVAYAQQNLTPSASGGNASFEAMDSQVRAASFSNNFINSSYELSFGQLEIPINLKYKLLEKDASEFYLITGLSNMVYLNQQNVGTFNTVNMITTGLSSAQPTVQTFTEVSRPNDRSDGVNMGRMLNFSMGYEYNLKNGTFLSLEPFYKMSIGNQTFADQQFSIGGINLRMNFQMKKK